MKNNRQTIGLRGRAAGKVTRATICWIAPWGVLPFRGEGGSPEMDKRRFANALTRRDLPGLPAFAAVPFLGDKPTGTGGNIHGLPGVEIP